MGALNGNDGVLKWNYTLVSFACGVPAVGRDGSLYVMTWKAGEFLTGSAQALTSNGTLKWIQNFTVSTTKQPLLLVPGDARGRDSLVLGSDGTVFASTSKAGLFALHERNGTIKWHTLLSDFS